ncbi:MAG: hypothetical protein AB7F89_17985 [Pirellulaceae bacterium]
MNQPPGTHLLVRSITPANAEPLDVSTINVLVGPNNSGKSEMLRDLARLIGNFDPANRERAANEEPRTRILQDMSFVPKLSLERLLRGISHELGGKSGSEIAGIGPDLRSSRRQTLAADLKTILFRPVITARSVWTTALGEVMPLRIAYLPSDQCTRLIEPSPAASPVQPPANLLQALHAAGNEAAEILDAAMVQLCEGHHVRLDATERIQLTLRIADQFPALSGNAVQDVLAYSVLPSLQDQGDGWKTCAAVVLTFLACPGRVILLDQPEACLQPRQAWKLGAWISEYAARLGTQVFVATQDASFLNGLFVRGADVSILRLERRNHETHVELVPPDVGKALALFPLFSAQNALGAMFQRGVVLTPEESDRIFYQSVAERTLPAANLAFLHVHGPRNLAFAARILRRARLPVSVIAELDIFQSESSYSDLVKSISQAEPPAPWLATRERRASHVEGWFDEQELSSTAHEVESFLDQFRKAPDTSAAPSAADVPASTDSSPGAAGRNTPASTRAKWDRLRREKLASLPVELRVWVEELITEMKRAGIFVSPKGRLQGWIAGPTAEDKEIWFNRALQALDRNECPAELRAFVAEVAAYVQPSLATARPARRNLESPRPNG